jgi:hypothetical protein
VISHLEFFVSYIAQLLLLMDVASVINSGDSSMNLIIMRLRHLSVNHSILAS